MATTNKNVKFDDYYVSNPLNLINTIRDHDDMMINAHGTVEVECFIRLLHITGENEGIGALISVGPNGVVIKLNENELTKKQVKEVLREILYRIKFYDTLKEIDHKND